MIINVLNVASITYLIVLFLTFFADSFIKKSKSCFYISLYCLSSFSYQLLSILIGSYDLYFVAFLIPIIAFGIIYSGTKVIEIYSNIKIITKIYLIIILSICFCSSIISIISIINYGEGYYESIINGVATSVISVSIIAVTIYNLIIIIKRRKNNNIPFYYLLSCLSIIFSYFNGAIVEVLDSFVFNKPLNLYFLTILSSLLIYGSYIYENYKTSIIKQENKVHMGLNYENIHINKLHIINNTQLLRNEIIFLNGLLASKSFKEISVALKVHEVTVKRIAVGLYAKFNVKDKSELVTFLMNG